MNFFENKVFVAIFLALTFIVVTNHWQSWNDGVKLVQASDVNVYKSIAEASPHAPSNPVPFHHGQRFAVHFVIGATSKILHLPLIDTYYFALIIIISALLFVLMKAADRIKLDVGMKILLFSLFILNPYTLRYYLIVPGMIADLVFVLGTAVVLYGILTEKFLSLLIGICLALLGRQTAMAILPVVSLWLIFAKKEISQGLIIAILTTLLFLGLNSFVARFTLPSMVNASFLFSLFGFELRDKGEVFDLAKHFLRILIPHIVILFCAARYLFRKKPSKEFWAFFFCGAAIASQPLLMAPHLVLQNENRLSSLAFVPFLLGFMIILRDQKKTFVLNRWSIIFGISLLLGSLHHVYSVIGPRDVREFVFLQIVVASVAGIMFYKIVWVRPSSD